MFVQCQNVAVTGSPLPAHVVQLHGSTKRKPLSNHRQIVLGLDIVVAYPRILDILVNIKCQTNLVLNILCAT